MSWGAERENNNSWDRGAAQSDNNNWDGGGDTWGDSKEQAEVGAEEEFIELADDHAFVKLSEKVTEIQEFIKSLKETSDEIDALEETLASRKADIKYGLYTTGPEISGKINDFIEERDEWRKNEKPALQKEKDSAQAKVNELIEKMSALPLVEEEKKEEWSNKEDDAGANDEWGAQKEESGGWAGRGDDKKEEQSWDAGGDKWAAGGNDW